MAQVTCGVCGCQGEEGAKGWACFQAPEAAGGRLVNLCVQCASMVQGLFSSRGAPIVEGQERAAVAAPAPGGAASVLAQAEALERQLATLRRQVAEAPRRAAGF
jgi:hypothetical protein